MAQCLARLTPAGHAYYCSGYTWKPSKHLLLLSDYLVKVSKREITRLIVTMPPQNGKSTMISQYFPSWYMGKYPYHRILHAMYEADIAAYWGELARDNVARYGQELFGISIKRDSRAKDFWRIKDYPGYMATAGVGGAITSKSADVFIIDDPIKNHKEANSKAIRNSIWDWWKSVAYTRQQPGSVYIILMTRWHEDDLVGRILQQEVENKTNKWTVLNLPAIATEPTRDHHNRLVVDPLGRKPGEALWPERYPIEVLRDIEMNQGTYWWNAQYMGRPSSPAGTYFQRMWYRYCKQDSFHYLLPDGRSFEKSKCYIQQIIDPAASEKQQADPFCLMTVAITPEKDQIILDVFDERIGSHRYEKVMLDYYERFKPSVILVENTTFGITILQQIKRHLPLRPVVADEDKVTRSITAQSRYSMGTIFHCLNSDGSKPSWVEPYEQELLDFSTGKHDDQVDCISYSSIYTMTHGRPGVK